TCFSSLRCSPIPSFPTPTFTVFPYTTLFRSDGGSQTAGFYAAFLDDVLARYHAQSAASRACVAHRHSRPWPFGRSWATQARLARSGADTSELHALTQLVCRLLLSNKQPTQPR